MKNIFKFVLASLSCTAVLASCEKMEDFSTKVDAPPVLVYATSAGVQNVHTTKVAHAPVGSFGSYEAVFPVTCNSGSHKAASVTVSFSAEAARAYKESKELEHTVLPADFIRLEKYVKGAESVSTPASEVVLSLAQDARITADSVKVTLIGDLSQLTDKSYIAALEITSDAFPGSEVMGQYYLEVLTEINCIRPLASASDMSGFAPASRSAWTCNMNNFKNLFDGSTSSRFTFPEQDNELIVDMQEAHIVTGIKLGLYYPSYYPVKIGAIEYSLDGERWEQAGTPDDNALISGNDMFIGFYGYLEARYLKMMVSYTNRYRYMTEFSIFEADSKDASLYFDCGENNTFSGQILHGEGSATGALNAEFNVKVAPQSQAAIKGTFVQDNSLVAKYNEANGTSFKEMPAANIKIEGAEFAIAAAATSSDNVTVTLTGDLSSFVDEDGYLIPITVNSSAAVSSSRGVVYIMVYPKIAQFRSDFTEASVDGTLVADRSGWSVSCSAYNYGSSAECLFDGDNNSYVDWYAWNGMTITFDLGQVYNVTGLMIQHNEQDSYYSALGSVKVEISTDGSSYRELDTANIADKTIMKFENRNVISFFSAKSFRYVRLTPNYGESTMSEFNVYVK
ncbi:MAG: discoidin domain-containing protein [Bacteroidales bacterium]|nr:discoidin domain-containing protein [Bacteroidales bacterium]